MLASCKEQETDCSHQCNCNGSSHAKTSFPNHCHQYSSRICNEYSSDCKRIVIYDVGNRQTCPLISSIILTTILGTPMRVNSKSRISTRYNRFHLFFLNTLKHHLYPCPLANSTFKEQLCPVEPWQLIYKESPQSDTPAFYYGICPPCRRVELFY